MPELTPPRGRDAAVAAAALAATYLLLIALGWVLIQAQPSREVAVVALPVAILVSLGVPTLFLVRFMRRRGLELGFTPLGKGGWHLLWRIPALMIASGLATGIVAPLLGLEPSPDTSAESIAGEATSSLPILLTIAGYLVLGPFIEELVFRRVLLGYFDTRMPGWVSILLSSALFGAVHMVPQAIVYAFFFGVGLAWLTRLHRGITGSFIAHLTNNTVASLGVFAALFAL